MEINASSCISAHEVCPRELFFFSEKQMLAITITLMVMMIMMVITLMIMMMMMMDTVRSKRNNPPICGGWGPTRDNL